MNDFVGVPYQQLGPGNPESPFGQLSLPDGRKVCECNNLAPYLVRLGVAGVTPNMGFTEAAELYAAFLSALGQAAASGAVSQWLAANRST